MVVDMYSRNAMYFAPGTAANATGTSCCDAPDVIDIPPLLELRIVVGRSCSVLREVRFQLPSHHSYHKPH